MGRKPLHVLIVENSADDHELILHSLRKGGFDVTATRVETAEDMRKAVEAKSWDAIISDYTMPDFDGMSALELVKSGGYDMPFIVVSGRADIAARMIKAGAHDYLNKSNLVELPPLLERELGEAEQRRLRKMAEAKLRETQQQFNQALEASSLGAFNWDIKKDTTWRSARYDQIFGLEPTTKVDLDIFLTQVVPGERDQVRATIARVVMTGHFEFECKIHRADSSLAHIGMRGKILYGEDEKPVGIVGTVADITERKLLEEQLRHAQKMEAIGHLAAGVAHDFNNILAVILMQAGLIEIDDGISEKARSGVEEITSAAERAANLTRQLLLFSRRQAMLPRAQELNEIVGNMTKMLQRILGEHVTTQFKWSTERLFIHADAGMIDQILMNLAVNARDAMPRGGQLIIETSAKTIDQLMAAQMPRARVGSFACLNVTDSGCGIPLENLERIFEPFFTTKAVGKGTGIGLATVFGIVQQHEGWIHVESKVGLGTSFRIYLPRLAETTVRAPDKASEAHTCSGCETILLVEDDPDVSKAVHTMLVQLGYPVLTACNGVDAMELWQKHRDQIRLLLTDLVMPDEFTGKDLAAKLLEAKPDLKVIYTSGYSMEASGMDGQLEEGLNFLPKPYTSQKLSQILRKNLD